MDLRTEVLAGIKVGNWFVVIFTHHPSACLTLFMPPKHSAGAKKRPVKTSTLARKEVVAKEAAAKFSAKKAASGKSAVRGKEHNAPPLTLPAAEVHQDLNTSTVTTSQTSEERDAELTVLRGEHFEHFTSHCSCC
jgi:hypothetical protein